MPTDSRPLRLGILRIGGGQLEFSLRCCRLIIAPMCFLKRASLSIHLVLPNGTIMSWDKQGEEARGPTVNWSETEGEPLPICATKIIDLWHGREHTGYLQPIQARLSRLKVRTRRIP